MQITSGNSRTVDVTGLLGAKRYGHIDLFVSELLGGFGDNELWPECMAPLEKRAREFNAVQGLPGPEAIPTRVQTFVAPVVMPDVGPDHLQKLWVVQTAVPLNPASSVQRVYALSHPFQPTENMCCAEAPLLITFTTDKCVTGLLGYFVADLVKDPTPDLTLSNTYGRETQGLKEWDPVFFPFQHAITGTFGVRFRRCGNAQGVWYEWDIEAGGHLEKNSSAKTAMLLDPEPEE
jgi:protein arginine N-methyltransferase 5